MNLTLDFYINFQKQSRPCQHVEGGHTRGKVVVDLES